MRWFWEKSLIVQEKNPKGTELYEVLGFSTKRDNELKAIVLETHQKKKTMSGTLKSLSKKAETANDLSYISFLYGQIMSDHTKPNMDKLKDLLGMLEGKSKEGSKVMSVTKEGDAIRVKIAVNPAVHAITEDTDDLGTGLGITKERKLALKDLGKKLSEVHSVGGRGTNILKVLEDGSKQCGHGNELAFYAFMLGAASAKTQQRDPLRDLLRGLGAEGNDE